MRIERRSGKKKFIWRFIGQIGSRNSVDEMGGSKTTFTPKI
jgi:hypothetical protein